MALVFAALLVQVGAVSAADIHTPSSAIPGTTASGLAASTAVSSTTTATTNSTRSTSTASRTTLEPQVGALTLLYYFIPELTVVAFFVVGLYLILIRKHP